MCTLGECDAGLRSLDPLLAVIASVEDSSLTNNNTAYGNTSPYQLSPNTLSLANRTIVYNNKAKDCYQRGNYDQALSALQNALRVMRHFHAEGGKEPASNNTLATILSNTAHVYSRMGELDMALTCCIEAYHAHDGTEDDFRASLLFNSGRLLILLDRGLDEAEHALTRSLRIIAANTESDTRERDIVTIQSVLLLLQEQREDDRTGDNVVDVLRKLIHQRTEIGYENKPVADLLYRLGELYMNRGRHDIAYMFLTETLRVRKLLKTQDTDIVLTLNKLGQCLQSFGDHQEEAMLCYREALRLKGRSIYQEPPHVQVVVATILYNYGMIQSLHYDQEDSMRNELALQSFRSCLDLRTKALGRMHPDVASVLHNIAFLLLQQGESTESLKLFRESLDIRWNTLGPNHHEVASSLRHIGRIHQDRGDFEQALQLHCKALVILQTSQSERSDDVVEVLMGLAKAHHSMGHFDQALRSYEEVVNILRHCTQQGKKGSPQHIAHVLTIMGNLEMDMANVEAADVYFAEAATLLSPELGLATASIVQQSAQVCAAAA